MTCGVILGRVVLFLAELDFRLFFVILIFGFRG